MCNGLRSRKVYALTYVMSDNAKLDQAYALNTPEDSVALYGDWATTYDTDFIDQSGYQLHLEVAKAFAVSGGTVPVLDMGAGTGACGQMLAQLDIGPIDGTDISPQMLEVAQTKGVYQTLFVGDILAGLDVAQGHYPGVVSSGTFTLGHVGPEGLDEVARVLAPDGLAVIAVRDAHYASAGFESKLSVLEPLLAVTATQNVRIYTQEQGDHADDMALLLHLRKR